MKKMVQQVLFLSELQNPPIGRVDPKPKLLPRRRPKRHLDASPAFGNEPRAICWETHRGNLGHRGARDKWRLVSTIRQTSCKWCLRVLCDNAQLQSFYVQRAPDAATRGLEERALQRKVGE